MQKQLKKTDETLINDMARELVKRYGDRAIAIAKERAEKAQVGKFPSDKNIAMLVLESAPPAKFFCINSLQAIYINGLRPLQLLLIFLNYFSEELFLDFRIGLLYHELS